ncbi:methyltransferase domain-containing protein [Burkholderia humptydooensis]|uniref:Methyltransferase domain-containing protein n=1 Tax=Burkholderia humptydooensis TaxID=430531 RepID=A0A7T2WWI8_9BURK|nr:MULTISPECIES: class I SAM-dependent methyltransferase [Burkholderia]AJY43872.1 mycolic acid cyclopropane synthetase family protein [Burkholderia sp. 2002721687]QPS42177.1 methyltransferase domain-containing protein [Burkholderia humptydooensis]
MNDDSLVSQSSYRTRIYAHYASVFQDANATFDADAAWRWGRGYRHYLRGWLPDSQEARVLDMACGGGKLLYFFKRMGYRKVCGVDTSPEQVRLSRQVTADVMQEDVLDFLEDRPQSYDLVTGLDIVEHLHKPEVLRLLDTCHAALKPGGRLVLQTPNADSPWGASSRYGDFTHELGFNPNSLSRLLALSGFCNIEVRETGPILIGHGVLSSVRYFIWQAIRAALILWNLAETGDAGSGVFTRVFLISAKRASK